MQEPAPVSPKNFPIEPQHVLNFYKRFYCNDLARFAFEHPPLDIVLAHEPELLVKNSALRRSIEFHARDISRIKMPDSTLEKRCADTLPSKLLFNQDHADPREPAFVNNRGRSSDHTALALSHETPFRASGEKPLPVSSGLVPAREVLQPHRFRHVIG